ncbi:MAG TPA: hypothetical protein VKP58_08100 [Candidatus Acidoferrum sp.]|nr:hypothetical protein [Candidatus Acidoferrum sp.]
MAEKFVSKSGAIEVELFAVETVTRFIGTPANPLTKDHAEMVRFTVRGGPTDSVEVSLEEFHEFFYRKIFPAVANRFSKSSASRKR